MTSQPTVHVVAAVLMVLASVPALGQETKPSTPARPDSWKYDVGLYLWMTDIEGDVTVRNLTAEADAEFSDIIDHLDATFAIHFEAWNHDAIGGILDLNFVGLESEPEFPGGGEGKVETSLLFLEAAFATRSRHGKVFADLFGGMRWTQFTVDVEAPGGASEDKTNDYFDPMIGVRVGWDAVDWLLLTFRMDAAGFGVGTEMTGNMEFAAAVKLSNWRFVGGWRTMTIQIEEDRADFDVTLRGPLLEVFYSF